LPSGLTLFTGFPGFIGNRLLEAILSADEELRVLALVEHGVAERAHEAAAGLDGDRIEVVPGDITEPRLGLDAERYEHLAGELTSVYHLAAVYDLAVELDAATRVNVEGTGNVVELCTRAERLEHFNYVSTAYVAGRRRGVVYEHELALGQGFKNHYEATKFQAEVWVRHAMDQVPTTIYRPAIVVGDSKSGETAKFDGPYYLLRTIALARRMHLPVPYVGRSDAPLNVVPVDYVTEAITAAAARPEAMGETLHLVDPDPLTTAEVMDLFAEEYAGRTPVYRLPAPLVRESLRLGPVQRLLEGMPRESMAYVEHPVRFDARRTLEVLEPVGLRPPNLREYVGPVVNFFRQHEDEPEYA
jgi:thioester reductase-like protein